jgi:hypothetical protein
LNKKPGDDENETERAGGWAPLLSQSGHSGGAKTLIIVCRVREGGRLVATVDEFGSTEID